MKYWQTWVTIYALLLTVVGCKKQDGRNIDRAHYNTTRMSGGITKCFGGGPFVCETARGPATCNYDGEACAFATWEAPK